MGTCPKCRQRIRRNGNHIKLGTTWYHKSCPSRPPKPAAGAQPGSSTRPAR